MRFGDSSIWKIGRTTDLGTRLAQVNDHIPVELLGQSWQVSLTHEWLTSVEAQAMEQRVLSYLSMHRTQGERVKCTKAELEEAWKASLLELNV